MLPKKSKLTKPDGTPAISNLTACQNLAAMVFGINPKQMSPAEFWTKLSDEFQNDMKAFVDKWPPGQAKARGCYRVEPKSPHSDETEVKPF